ncbi:MAG: hypothetical protein ACRES9_12470 [Gammaproteobacteria bacterium]
MAEEQLIFVVGAGASSEAELPFGRTFTTQIAQNLDISLPTNCARQDWGGTIFQALRLRAQEPDPSSREIKNYVDAAWRVRDAMPIAESIDQFLDANHGDEKINLCANSQSYG